jgi:ubiquinone/menaquinone biosynthesis C-methylase UbiE
VENARHVYNKFYDALHHFLDYANACRKLHALIQLHNPGARTLLDVARGTGKHVEFLLDHYQVEGLDLCQDMLAVARERSPGVPFYQGDMVDFKLDRTFDVVTCLFRSIGYVKTVERIERAIANMARHLRPGGMLVVEPWFVPRHKKWNTGFREFKVWVGAFGREISGVLTGLSGSAMVAV